MRKIVLEFCYRCDPDQNCPLSRHAAYISFSQPLYMIIIVNFAKKGGW